MSILIKGMEMPKGCITCVFEFEGLYDWTMWCQWLDDPLGDYGERDGKWRHPDCPLVEVSEKAVSPCEECPFIKAEEAEHERTD